MLMIMNCFVIVAYSELPLKFSIFICLLIVVLRSKKCPQDLGFFAEEVEHVSLNIPGSLLGILQCGKELLMVKISPVNSIHHVGVNLCAESNVLVSTTELAVKNIVGMLNFQ